MEKWNTGAKFRKRTAGFDWSGAGKAIEYSGRGAYHFVSKT
jgi:hypothetical protein